MLQTLKSAAESSMPALILRIHSSYVENNFLHHLLTLWNNRFEVPNNNRPLNLLNIIIIIIITIMSNNIC